jgi:hypothetical protein
VSPHFIKFLKSSNFPSYAFRSLHRLLNSCS